MTDSLADLLSYGSYNVEKAYSGAEGIEKIKLKNYHVVLTDLRMPDVSGFDVIDHINTHSPQTIIIIITGHPTTESAIQAIQAGAFDYVTKPFDFEMVRNSIEKAFMKVEADRLREEMIHMITHDLKIPLTSIIGCVGMIYDRKTGEISPNAKGYVSTINYNGQKILSLIDNFLTSCKIKEGKLAICKGEVGINILVDDILSIMRPILEKQGIALHVSLQPDTPQVTGDENLLFRAIGNVLNNAAKYTPDGGEIEVKTMSISAEDSPLEKPSLGLVVRNTGPGIPPQELPGIFDRFQRACHVGRIEGSGLGL
ncbi:MAG: response regulator, partial [Candidatus Sumerlaeota bacterium]|nr:response regulator [Candidatus Sumerlaeota bacterium]